MNRKRFLLCLAVIVLVAFLLRLAICFSLADTPAVRAPSQVTDMATYLHIAKEICAGNWPDHFDYQPFYYTIVLPFCRLFFGDSPWGFMLLQTLLGAMTVFLAGIATAQIFRNRIAGLLAAALLTLSKMHIFYTPFALFETVQSFWMALLLGGVSWYS